MGWLRGQPLFKTKKATNKRRARLIRSAIGLFSLIILAFMLYQAAKDGKFKSGRVDWADLSIGAFVYLVFVIVPGCWAILRIPNQEVFAIYPRGLLVYDGVFLPHHVFLPAKRILSIRKVKLNPAKVGEAQTADHPAAPPPYEVIVPEREVNYVVRGKRSWLARLWDSIEDGGGSRRLATYVVALDRNDEARFLQALGAAGLAPAVDPSPLTNLEEILSSW